LVSGFTATTKKNARMREEKLTSYSGLATRLYSRIGQRAREDGSDV
jgi:hypothetical protein